MSKMYYLLLYIVVINFNTTKKTEVKEEEYVFKEFTCEEKQKEAENFFKNIYEDESICLSGIYTLEAYRNFMTKFEEIHSSNTRNRLKYLKDRLELFNLGQEMDKKKDEFYFKLKKNYPRFKEAIKNMTYYITAIDLLKENISQNDLREQPNFHLIKNFLEKVRHSKNLPSQKFYLPIIKITDTDTNCAYTIKNIMTNYYDGKVTLEDSYEQLTKTLSNCIFKFHIKKIESKVTNLDGYSKEKFEQYAQEQINLLTQKDLKNSINLLKKKIKKEILLKEKMLSKIYSKQTSDTSNSLLPYRILGIILYSIIIYELIEYVNLKLKDYKKKKRSIN